VSLWRPFSGTGAHCSASPTRARIRNRAGESDIHKRPRVPHHPSERTPRHLFAEFLAIGIDARPHGGDEFRKAPLLDEIEITSERPDLPRHAAVINPPRVHPCVTRHAPSASGRYVVTPLVRDSSQSVSVGRYL
jgi:hypothetical protein